MACKCNNYYDGGYVCTLRINKTTYKRLNKLADKTRTDIRGLRVRPEIRETTAGSNNLDISSIFWISLDRVDSRWLAAPFTNCEDYGKGENHEGECRSTSHNNNRPCEWTVSKGSSVGEKRGFRYLWHTVLCLLDVSNCALFTMISSVSGSTRAFILLCHGSSVLTNEWGVAEWASVANIAETKSVESSSRNSVETGTHVAEESSPSLETFTFSLNQLSFSWFAVGHFLASVSR